MNEQNPYKPILSEPAKPLKRIRWVRRFAILNCVIFSIPVLGAFAAYLVLEANGIYFSGVSVTMGTELVVLLVAYVPFFVAQMLRPLDWLEAAGLTDGVEFYVSLPHTTATGIARLGNWSMSIDRGGSGERRHWTIRDTQC